jgi:hypothetical protein
LTGSQAIQTFARAGTGLRLLASSTSTPDAVAGSNSAFLRSAKKPADLALNLIIERCAPPLKPQKCGNGFDPTFMTWSFTTQDPRTGRPRVFSFSAASGSVPDGGSTVALLGLAIVGVEALRQPPDLRVVEAFVSNAWPQIRRLIQTQLQRFRCLAQAPLQPLGSHARFSETSSA